jgi:hypothetical protein
VGHLYFLFYGGEVIYIGKSTNVIVRLREHVTYHGIEMILVIPCKLSRLEREEVKLIKNFRPRCNGMHNMCNRTGYLPKKTAHTLTLKHLKNLVNLVKPAR